MMIPGFHVSRGSPFIEKSTWKSNTIDGRNEATTGLRYPAA